MTPAVVTVAAGETRYPVLIHQANWQDLGGWARRSCPASLQSLIVSDIAVASYAEAVRGGLEQHGFRVQTAWIPSGETSKSLAQAARLYDELVAMEADRLTLVVAVGGGVVGDLAGFVAATFCRGIPWLMVPTTLLAMVDSSIGGKVAVNHPRGKNLIGAFHQPIAVWISLHALDTLPEREYRSGLAEVVKYGVILDEDFFAYLERHLELILARNREVLHYVVLRCCQLKAQVVEEDPTEQTGRRAILNYGHTFGHAFETVSGYGTWLHGEAVAAGMICASRLAEKLGLITPEVTERQRRLLQRLGLPTRPQPWPVAELLAVMRHDKKARAGQLRFILPNRIGAVQLVSQVPEQLVVATLEELMQS
ncbi:MAG: 3-dehydroquinate synthase [Gemmatales bacterium]|nr:3-dehydroquinate synthase [Gemmatales bacterium]MCS7161544.1 3-dehydroquinate synthase [Gemmatales bacterium]MDW8176747.1 3-dehydroquinate synthase [Gemmatales bacterium]MDW8222033.1 3-dehydroquinate synthase [Gemmatales bacterium]